MLNALFVAPNNELSLAALASAAGYSTTQPVNAQLGRVGRQVVERTGLRPRYRDRSSGEPVLISVFADWNNLRETEAEWAWRLYPEFAQALLDAGFASNSTDHGTTPPARDLDIIADLDAAEAALLLVPASERAELRLARVGQGVFRASLLKLWRGCSLTGLPDAGNLRASHLKPWRDSTNAERLDPSNGLLLLPSADHCVDRGLCAFDNEGRILISSQLSSEERQALGLRPRMKLRTVWPALQAFLCYHRERVFLP